MARATSLAKRFGRLIRDARTEAHLTQEELAERLGLSDRAIRRIENAETEPKLSQAVKISRYLNISLDDLPL